MLSMRQSIPKLVASHEEGAAANTTKSLLLMFSSVSSLENADFSPQRSKFYRLLEPLLVLWSQSWWPLGMQQAGSKEN